MKAKKVETPKELVAALIELFPAFRDECESFGDTGVYGFHAVFSELAPSCLGYLDASTPRTIEAFCALVNQCVVDGGELENAVSTCLLEHASQIGIAKIIRPYLSPAAKADLR